MTFPELVVTVVAINSNITCVCFLIATTVTCSYSSGYQETYTSNVTVDLTGSNPTVTLSNIGNGESYSIQLDRDY